MSGSTTRCGATLDERTKRWVSIPFFRARVGYPNPKRRLPVQNPYAEGIVSILCSSESLTENYQLAHHSAHLIWQGKIVRVIIFLYGFTIKTCVISPEVSTYRTNRLRHTRAPRAVNRSPPNLRNSLLLDARKAESENERGQKQTIRDMLYRRKS